MRLSEDVLKQAVKSLQFEQFNPAFRIGREPCPVSRPPRAVLAARGRVRPCSNGSRQRAWSVSLRSVTASGVVFVDGNYWLDGEQFILQLPKSSNAPAMLCAITYWQPLASDLCVVSASFVRPIQGPREKTPARRPAPLFD